MQWHVEYAVRRGTHPLWMPLDARTYLQALQYVQTLCRSSRETHELKVTWRLPNGKTVHALHEFSSDGNDMS